MNQALTWEGFINYAKTHTPKELEEQVKYQFQCHEKEFQKSWFMKILYASKGFEEAKECL